MATPMSVSAAQDSTYGNDHDYVSGSPHLRHNDLRNEITSRLRELVAEQLRRSGRCRVLEVGAGHGHFTDPVAAMGATVTVTEMSRASLDLLQERYAHNPDVEPLYDDGHGKVVGDRTFDLVVCVSVLHHIPDYLSFVKDLVDRIEDGGSLASFQDPLWYPRRSKLNRMLHLAAYVPWRVTRGDVFAGATRRINRSRGHYDESDPANLVEYHVARQGVDENSIEDLLAHRFQRVRQWHYWSTQSPFMHALGSRTPLKSTFGIVARGKC